MDLAASLAIVLEEEYNVIIRRVIIIIIVITLFIGGWIIEDLIDLRLAFIVIYVLLQV